MRTVQRINVTLCALLIMVLCACTTVIKHPIVSKGASWDGTQQNSGWYGQDDSGAGLVSQHFVDRYNALCVKWGERFVPPIRPGEGLTYVPFMQCWRIDQQHASAMAKMNRWNKEDTR